MRRRLRSSPFVYSVALLLVALCLFQHARSENGPSDSVITTESAWSLPSTSAALVKYGNPVPHKLVGPYHVLVNEGYVSGYDAGIQDPRWVESCFFAVPNPNSKARPDEFTPDDRIEPEFQVNSTNWTATGYDRGHMAPNWGISICYGRRAQLQTFLLTNIIPQTPVLNQGLWETLEKIISNDYANRFGKVWVICGPMFESNLGTLKEGKVLIPDKCYKIVLRVDENNLPHALAFVMPQDLAVSHQQRDLLQYLTSITKIQEVTGIDFFPDLPAEMRTAVEDEVATKMW